jgi:hypothetical protein
VNYVKNLFLYLSLTLTFIYCFLGFIYPLSFEQDLGRHLLFGKIMVETGEVINTNLLSYTNPDFKYINSHWGSEVIFHLINITNNSFGLIILTAVVFIATSLILFLFTYKRVAISAIVITFPVLLSFLIFRADVRPEMFSYLFTAIFISILFRFREKRTKFIYLLIPIAFLWVNLHIYFAVGLGLIFLFLLENLILDRFKFNKKTKELTLIFLLSSFAVLINPNFISGALFPLLVFNNYGIDIHENLSLISLGSKYNINLLIPHFLYLIAINSLLLIYRKKLYFIEIFLVIIFSIAGFLIFRNFYILVIVSFFSFTKLTGYFLNDIEKILSKYVSKIQLLVLKTVSYFFLCIIIFILIYMKFITGGGFSLESTERAKPAVDFFIKNDIKGPTYNSFDLGQYMAYRLYPEHRIYVDARPEAYPSSFLENYTKHVDEPEVFAQEEEKYGFNSYIFYLSLFDEPELTRFFLDEDKYKMIYLDTYAMIFVKDINKNEDLIKRFEIEEDTFKLKGNEGKADLSKYVIIFDEIGWKKAQKYTFGELLKKDKDTCILKSILKSRPLGHQNLKSGIALPKTSCN